MAHVGQEFGLGLVGVLGLIPRSSQFRGSFGHLPLELHDVFTLLGQTIFPFMQDAGNNVGIFAGQRGPLGQIRTGSELR